MMGQILQNREASKITGIMQGRPAGLILTLNVLIGRCGCGRRRFHGHLNKQLCQFFRRRT